MRYYKIIRGYGAEDYIEIDETELEKAYFAFLTKKDSVYSGGAVRGSEIMAIQPDYHRAMGWNRGYKLDSFDYQELSEKGLDKTHTHFLSDTKDRIQHLIETNQTHLIGKGVEVKLDKPNTEVSEQSKILAEKMKI